MAEHIEDDLLVALADGELPAEEAEQLQKLVDRDPDAAARLEAFKASRDALRAMFNSESLEPTPAHIAEKIRDMGKQEEAIADVVQFDAFKKRRERALEHRTFSFRSIQRYAAMLILGGAIGFGFSSEFNESDLNEGMYSEDSRYALRGSQQQAASDTNGASIQNLSNKLGDKIQAQSVKPSDVISIELVDMQGNSFSTGEFISKNLAYRLIITSSFDGKLLLEYVEGSEAPKKIISEQLVKANQPFTFPQSGYDGIEFETDQKIVSFIATFVSSSVSVSNVYSFGIRE